TGPAPTRSRSRNHQGDQASRGNSAMRHRNSGRKLGRNASHRAALFNNLVTSLLTYGRTETTEAKAKELRGFADATISRAISVHGLIAKGDKATKAERAQIIHARRMARRTVKTPDA